MYSQKYSHWIRVLLYCFLLLAASMGTTIEQLPVKDRLSQQFWQSQGCFTCGRAVLEYNAFDVLLKCVLLAIIKRLCWTLQVVERGDVLVYSTDVLQCLHAITYKARYVQRCRVMRFMLFLISITKNPILYTLYLVKVVGFIDIYIIYTYSFILCFKGPIDTSPVTEEVTLFKY